MIIIATINAIKEFFVKKHAEQSLKSLDAHSLRDIGFYHDNGRIRPLAGTTHENKNLTIHKMKPHKQPSDG
ncbi:hypothetical protein O1D97_01380 [Marinomonas sp. 15G1-11]|uniref:DUF1127 domain-containing protein n=1 Tax=Marinomonas phaeophyticola TaxID=3004091 RepID=A0ABT4JPL6_9GAMM|nr:hypothetical protein [Marinomonas sp. 15G1-11]MCZ2720327.1 hypothetical protein [Marinomonas sp. 15G1-11]